MVTNISAFLVGHINLSNKTRIRIKEDLAINYFKLPFAYEVLNLLDNI